MISRRRAFICGIRGIKLNKKESFFLKKYKPWGVILFSRNLKTIKQSQNLTKSIKKIFYDDKYPILVDEEGKHDDAKIMQKRYQDNTKMQNDTKNMSKTFFKHS